MSTPTDPAPSAAVKERLKQKRDYDESEAHRYDAMGCPGIADRCMDDSKLYAAAIALIERGELERERLDWLLEKGVSINVSESGPGYGCAYTRLFPSRETIDTARAPSGPNASTTE